MRDAQRARQIVTAPAGQHREGTVAPGERARHLPDQSVAAEGRHGLAGRRRGARQRVGVLERLGALHVKGDPEAPQRRLDGGQRLGGAPAAGLGIDDKGDGAIHD